MYQIVTKHIVHHCINIRLLAQEYRVSCSNWLGTKEGVLHKLIYLRGANFTRLGARSTKLTS